MVARDAQSIPGDIRGYPGRPARGHIGVYPEVAEGTRVALGPVTYPVAVMLGDTRVYPGVSGVPFGTRGCAGGTRGCPKPTRGHPGVRTWAHSGIHGRTQVYSGVLGRIWAYSGVFGCIRASGIARGTRVYPGVLECTVFRHCLPPLSTSFFFVGRRGGSGLLL